jgi:hypothetical protein
MHHRQPGPPRSASIQSYLWQTRTLAAVAALAFVAGVLSDVLAPHFWSQHQLLAGLASSLIVVMLTVAVLNEAIEWRRRMRWSVLAQYVMLQLVRHARMVWMGIAELSGILPSEALVPASIDAGARVIRDTQQLAGAVRGLLDDPRGRPRLQDAIVRMVDHSDDLLGRWAGVMLNTDAYAELIDRHVELASSIAWLESLLDNFEPPEDGRRRRRARAHPAVQLEGRVDDESVAERLVGIAQLAERLDAATLQLASRVVPREWWRERFTTLDSSSDSSEAVAESSAT